MVDTIKLNKGLGWFSIALGLAEVAFGRRIANAVQRGDVGDVLRLVPAVHAAAGWAQDELLVHRRL